MKRFYINATVAQADTEHGTAFAIDLDSKPVNTPSRRRLAVPTRALAIAIAEEWNAQHDQIDVCAMRLTGLANAAIDHVAADRDGFIDTLAKFGETDLFYYRTENPDALIEKQAAAWNPVLDWLERDQRLTFAITSGITYVEQPSGTLSGLRSMLEEQSDFALAALNPLVTIGGSLAAALAIVKKAFGADDMWEAVTLDERWQEQQWGADDEAKSAMAARKVEWDAATVFLCHLA